MNAQKKGRLEEIIRHYAARFFSTESNYTSMITVTKVASTGQSEKAMIYFTVYPEDQEQAALDFARRQRSGFRNFVRENSRLSSVPFFDFAIDRGEKARQKIDALTL